jgi:hypothetical protein
MKTESTPQSHQWPTDVLCRLLLPAPMQSLGAIATAIGAIARKNGTDARMRQVGNVLEFFAVPNGESTGGAPPLDSVPCDLLGGHDRAIEYTAACPPNVNADARRVEQSKKQTLVSLRRETFDDVVGLLKLVLHECDEYTGKCCTTCIACEAEQTVKAMEQQANAPCERRRGE